MVKERRTPSPEAPKSDTSSRDVEAKAWASNIAAFSFLALSVSLLTSVVFGAAIVADSESVDALYVLGTVNGSIGILAAVGAAVALPWMGSQRRRLAKASFILAGIQVVAVPALVLLGLVTWAVRCCG